MKTALLILSHLAVSAFSFPSQTEPPLISFDKGGIGVNFLGYHASAGLGGLLTGNAADGGLFAQAGTPHGQRAGAGLGGTVSEGRAAGGLYAGATAGGGVSAGAGLHGVSGEGGSAGALYSGASAGGKTYTSEKYGGTINKEVEVIKEKVIETPVSAPAPAPAKASAGFSGGLYISKSVNAAPAPAVHHVEQVVEKKVPAPQKTYIERTVIPNYVEKTIQVPSYEERIVRVPTVIEQRVKVPAPPTIIEKEVPVPEAPAPPQVHVQKIKTVHRPALRKHWRKYGYVQVE
ncbi:uncharacterized protein LOC108744856 isoform X1 [Agrilus planipennis]|uniref:Uncharacterized protein LOC108744856 isoform X1 n=1 Tax=Agrilus planipennis TaxID=224129 RepID=A0A7F5QZV1_AGRPL|nr:uncharacterized protein LOC108744856 isoform X1 [Agrilus planipennis]